MVGRQSLGKQKTKTRPNIIGNEIDRFAYAMVWRLCCNLNTECLHRFIGPFSDIYEEYANSQSQELSQIVCMQNTRDGKLIVALRRQIPGL